MDFITEIFYNGPKSENGMIIMLYCSKYDSPLGPIWLTGEDGNLTGLSFAEIRGEFIPENFDAVKCWLDYYFQGISREVDFPMDPSGTPFQKQVWKHLLEIPFGGTCTYGELAKKLSSNMSPQAVGQAVSRNPIAIIIPCHRVIGSDGTLTGYAWGIEKKRWLLDHEHNRR